MHSVALILLIQGAKSGHSLLKKKADALKMKFRGILKEIVNKKEKMGDIMKKANFSLAEAKFSAGDFNSDVIQNVGSARLRLRARTDNVAGVSLPIFEVKIMIFQGHRFDHRFDSSLHLSLFAIYINEFKYH